MSILRIILMSFTSPLGHTGRGEKHEHSTINLLSVFSRLRRTVRQAPRRLVEIVEQRPILAKRKRVGRTGKEHMGHMGGDEAGDNRQA